MNVQQLRDFYGARNNLELAKIIGYARSSLTGWEKNEIPPKTQAYFEVRTQGVLKADIQDLSASA